MKKRKRLNLLKLGVFLFGVSLLLWNCQDETIEKQENNIATVGLEEALNLFKATSSAKLHTNTYFVAHLEKIHQEDIINSEERLTIIPVSTKDSGYYSRIVLLKVNGNIQSVIFSMYPSSTKKETKGFTGEIIITDLEGNFLKGYRANSGNLITKFTKKVLSVNKSSKGGVCPDHGDCTANSLCVYCTQELDEVVVSGNTSGGSAPVDYILDFSGTGPDDGSSGDPNTSMGWDYGDGGGGNTSNSTQDPCNEIKKHLSTSGSNIKPELNILKTKVDYPGEKSYAFIKKSDGTFLNREVAVPALNFNSVKIPTGNGVYAGAHTHTDDLHNMFSWSDVHTLYSLYNDASNDMKSNAMLYLVARQNTTSPAEVYGIIVEDFNKLKSQLNKDIVNTVKNDPILNGQSSLEDVIKEINKNLGDQYTYSSDLNKTFLDWFKNHGIKLFKGDSNLSNFSELTLDATTNTIKQTPC
ncbi:hypothetical protein [Tenacibaculum singaporense]|uniref:hypothetical protein n=1 Tax=Tenacibaculum singaporense TaxID=2358479 RepID=UPI000F65BB1E|nr:hypothetical protein [Tenacibaculum singaporense]RSC96099.1 hypothetical protein EI424_02980 [Tenacibaculum singaporense]